jgi:hypothetical protein
MQHAWDEETCVSKCVKERDILGDFRHGRQDNIKIYLKEIRWGVWSVFI